MQKLFLSKSFKKEIVVTELFARFMSVLGRIKRDYLVVLEFENMRNKFSEKKEKFNSRTQRCKWNRRTMAVLIL